MDPHKVQSSFHIAGLRYSVGNLHFSSLRLVILITTEPFPFGVKVVLSCSAQQDFLALCAVSPSSGYLGCGLPAHPWVEPSLWPKCHLAVAGLSNAAHSSHGCTAVFSWPWSRSPSSLPHGTVLFAFFLSCVYGRRRICSAAEAERLFCALAAPDGWLVGLSRSSTALRGSEQVTAMLGRLWDSLLHLLPFLYSSGKPLIANKIGKDFFFCGATRSAFSKSEELEEWIWI